MSLFGHPTANLAHGATPGTGTRSGAVAGDLVKIGNSANLTGAKLADEVFVGATS